MVKDILENRIQILDSVSDWKCAIEMVIRPLEKDGVVDGSYLQGIYDNVARNGDYFIIMPGFALPHAKGEQGALRSGLSFLKLKKPVTFSSGQNVTYLMGLASNEPDAHVDTLAELAEILTDEEKIQKLEKAQTKEEVLEIFA